MIDAKGDEIRQRAETKHNRVAVGEMIEQHSVITGKAMPPSEPAVLPTLVSVATAFFGNMSETVV